MDLPKGEVLESNIPGVHSIGVRRPLGVVASFTPWNGANVLSWRAVISPVAAGNTVVVKPSELAIAEEAGFPSRQDLVRPGCHVPARTAHLSSLSNSALVTTSLRYAKARSRRGYGSSEPKSTWVIPTNALNLFPRLATLAAKSQATSTSVQTLKERSP
jgi:hypothetical protein